MMERKSKSGSAIRLVAVGGIVILTLLVFLGFGVFGTRMLAAMAAMPKPEAPPRPAPAPLAASSASPAVPPKSAEAATSQVAEVSPEIQRLLDVGKGVFLQCAACHGPAGKSLIPAMAPNLAGSSIANGPSARVVAVVLNGIQPEGRFQGVMVPWKAMLTDEQIAGVLTYVRSSFGNQAPPITPDMVARAREKYAPQVNPMMRAEVEAITAELPQE